MPKVTKAQRDAKFDPYSRSSQTPPSSPIADDRDDGMADEIAKSKRNNSKGGGGGGAASGVKYEYNKVLLTTLILAPIKPNWDAFAASFGTGQEAKSRSQLYDLWRKSMSVNLLAGKPWSTGSSDSNAKQTKVKLMNLILDAHKPDWGVIIEYFPGRTKNQLIDVWRKGIAPRLRRGDPIE